MSKLNIDQKSIRTLFSEKKADFLIPDYQRPYAWEEKECQTLWDDLFLFAFPDNDCDKFNSESDEYFLGPIVTFKNEEGKMEIIDGQQRLTTLMLLLRAFYEKYGSMKNDKAVKTSKFIEQCIWKTDEFGDPNKSALKIDSEVATDKEKDEFLHILKTGTVTDIEKSNYANNYRFFQKKIVEFLNAYPDWFSFFPIRISQLKFLYPLKTLAFPAFSPPRFGPFPSFFPLREEMRETFFRPSLQPYPEALRKFAWPLWWHGRKCSSWYLHQNVPAAPVHPWVLPREREGWSYMYASTDGNENHPYPRSFFGSIGIRC